MIVLNNLKIHEHFDENSISLCLEALTSTSTKIHKVKKNTPVC